MSDLGHDSSRRDSRATSPYGLLVMRDNAALVASDPGTATVEQIRDVALSLTALIDTHMAGHGLPEMDYGQLCAAVHDFVIVNDDPPTPLPRSNVRSLPPEWASFEAILALTNRDGSVSSSVRHPNLASAAAAVDWAVEQVASQPTNTSVRVTVRNCADPDPFLTVEGTTQHLLDELAGWRAAARGRAA